MQVLPGQKAGTDDVARTVGKFLDHGGVRVAVIGFAHQGQVPAGHVCSDKCRDQVGVPLFRYKASDQQHIPARREAEFVQDRHAARQHRQCDAV